MIEFRRAVRQNPTTIPTLRIHEQFRYPNPDWISSDGQIRSVPIGTDIGFIVLGRSSVSKFSKICRTKLSQFYEQHSIGTSYYNRYSCVTCLFACEMFFIVSDCFIDCIESEGFPEATILPMNESVVTDNVGLILQAMVSHCKRTMNRDDLKLSREKQIISKDEQVGGNMEFIIIQKINVRNTRSVLVVEAKRDLLGKGLIQLLLALKSIWDINNDKKMVYGFLTTGINWQLVTYDGKTWTLSEPSTTLFGNMGQQEDRWLNNNTQILDAIYSILLSI